MATHKSAIKKHRQEIKRRLRNRRHRTRLRGRVKAIRKAVEAGDAETARSMLPGILSLIDRTSKLGVIHDNAADRTKSRLARAVHRLGAKSS